MARVAVVHHSSTPTWSVSELIKCAKRRGHIARYYRIQDIDAAITDRGIVIQPFAKGFNVDAVVVRSLGINPSVEQLVKRMGILDALRLSGTIVINKPASMLQARDKWTALVKLYSSNIRVPETIVTENPFTAMKAVEKMGSSVFKPIIGSLGLGSALVSNTDIAFQISKSLNAFRQPTYIQKYIPKPGYDVRVFVVGERVVGAMKRVISRGWKTNIAQGARGVALKESDDPESYELGIKASKVLDLDYAGVDIVISKDSCRYVIEVNASPQWRGLMMATGVNPAEYIIEYVVSKARK
ncbi:MAG: RimK family alpha-L-glutamate ligase [Desulfurococcaceae archaeon]|nr:RimK family alpha-L-glutamate ligase [Sulfolobales archaeon]MDW8170210.1 RimK family alpha-L-glutamate ligase [Desulfurococcaceae archaeon]